MVRGSVVLGAVAGSLLVAACGSTSRDVKVAPSTTRATTTTTSSTTTTEPPTTQRATTTAKPTTTPAPTAAPATAPPQTAPPAPPQPAPTPAPTPAPAPVSGNWRPVVVANGQTLASTISVNVDGAQITVVRIAASAHLHLYSGLGGSTAIDAATRPHAIVSFNGGFDFTTGDASISGIRGPDGTYGTLNPGMAAVVGYADGGFALGQWGRDVPASGRKLAWARTNVQLLVDGGRPTAAVGDVNLWGVPLNTVGFNTARSALGIDQWGNLLYAASMATYPGPLANALVAEGAQRAMELDINPWWVRSFAYPNGQSTSLFNNPNGSGDVFAGGWSRDFFVAATV